MNYLFLAISVASAVLLTLMSYKMFQIFQLSSYRAKGVWNWIKTSKGDYIVRYFSAAFFSFIGMWVYVACFGAYRYVDWLGLLLYALFCVLFSVFTLRVKSKTPLVLTARAGRFIAVTFVLYIPAGYGLLVLGDLTPLQYAMLGILPFLIPLVVLLAHVLVLPFESLNHLGYRNRAVKKLRNMPQLIRIGITGSYGKTTAKNLLAAMLAKKYRVCATPGSYNTPMGISKVVNNDLSDEDEILVAEMGARNRGDIAELADIVQPTYGLITAVGNQHLETFGSREAIVATKFELIEHLAAGGLAAFNGDNEDARAMFERASTEKLLSGSAELADASATYRDVTTDRNGTTFTLTVGEESVKIHTVLLGGYVPATVTLCAAVARRLGVSLEAVAQAMEEVAPVPHRLELSKCGDGVILDDAYNSNPAGAASALAVLKEFTDLTRVIITPGMVELGAEEQEANKELGRQIAVSADYAFLVGSRAEDLRAGAVEAGMPEDRVRIVATLDEAVKAQQELPGAKAVLFENDLPDHY